MLLLARNKLTTENVEALAESTFRISGAKWLLVDQALVEAQRSEALAKRLGWNALAAFSGSRLEVFGAQGPQLMAVPTCSKDEWVNALFKWVALEPTGAGLSVISSGAEMPQMLPTLSYLALATVEGGLPLHCRCADARVLAHLLAVLTDEQTALVSQTVASWWWWDAEGRPGSWMAGPAGGLKAQPSSDSHLQLTSGQYAMLMDRSEPDIMFSLLMDKTSELVPDDDRGAFRALLQRILLTADGYAVQQTMDRLQFIVLSLATGEAFHLHPALQAMWQRVRAQGASLSQEMESWSDDLWAELDHGRRPAQ